MDADHYCRHLLDRTRSSAADDHTNSDSDTNGDGDERQVSKDRRRPCSNCVTGFACSVRVTHPQKSTASDTLTGTAGAPTLADTTATVVEAESCTTTLCLTCQLTSILLTTLPPLPHQPASSQPDLNRTYSTKQSASKLSTKKKPPTTLSNKNINNIHTQTTDQFSRNQAHIATKMKPYDNKIESRSPVYTPEKTDMTENLVMTENKGMDENKGITQITRSYSESAYHTADYDDIDTADTHNKGDNYTNNNYSNNSNNYNAYTPPIRIPRSAPTTQPPSDVSSPKITATDLNRISNLIATGENKQALELIHTYTSLLTIHRHDADDTNIVNNDSMYEDKYIYTHLLKYYIEICQNYVLYPLAYSLLLDRIYLLVQLVGIHDKEVCDIYLYMLHIFRKVKWNKIARAFMSAFQFYYIDKYGSSCIHSVGISNKKGHNYEWMQKDRFVFLLLVRTFSLNFCLVSSYFVLIT